MSNQARLHDWSQDVNADGTLTVRAWVRYDDGTGRYEPFTTASMLRLRRWAGY